MGQLVQKIAAHRKKLRVRMRKTHIHECNFSQMTLCTHPPHLCCYFIIQPVCESTPLTLISAAEYGWEVTVTTKKTLDSNYDGAYLAVMETSHSWSCGHRRLLFGLDESLVMSQCLQECNSITVPLCSLQMPASQREFKYPSNNYFVNCALTLRRPFLSLESRCCHFTHICEVSSDDVWIFCVLEFLILVTVCLFY